MSLIKTGRFYYVFFIVFWLLSLPVTASDNYDHKLWSISQNGEIKGYLLGTVHLPRRGIWRDVYGLEDVLRNKTRRLVVEMDEGLFAKRPDYLYSGPRLFDHLKDANLRRVISEALDWQVPGNLNLLALYIMLSHHLYGIGQGQMMFDHQLVHEATRLGKSVDSLDTPEQIMDIAASFSISEYEQVFRELVEEVSRKVTTAESLERDYWSGRLSREFFENQEYKRLRELLITRRNKSWLPKIKNQHLQGETALIAVGAHHLYGQYGLIRMLENEGYTLAPISRLTPVHELLSGCYGMMHGAFDSEAGQQFRQSCSDAKAWVENQAESLYQTYGANSRVMQWINDNYLFSSCVLFSAVLTTCSVGWSLLTARRDDRLLRQARLR